ncbi:MAG: WYL domain-containing protein [Actinomycetota bacterium]
MSSRPTAPDRMRRVLAVVPWIVANPGRTVNEVASRFGLSEDELLGDLNVVFMVGLPPYSPDALVDVQIDDEGRVSIQLADFFSRPLRLTPDQAVALIASSDGLLSIPGTDPDGALARALRKLGAALGIEATDALDIHLGDAESSMLDELRSAAAGEAEVAIRYYSYGRDERTERVIAPWRVFADSGSWYVHGWCHRADGERVFRVDRIEHLERLEGRTEHPPPADGPISVFSPGSDDPTVELALSADAAWVADYYPVEIVARTDDELVVRLVVTAVPWLERLLIRLGPSARVIGADGLEGASSMAATAAGRVLRRYRS